MKRFLLCTVLYPLVTAVNYVVFQYVLFRYAPGARKALVLKAREAQKGLWADGYCAWHTTFAPLTPAERKLVVWSIVHWRLTHYHADNIGHWVYIRARGDRS